MKRAKYKRYITAVVLFVILAIILTPLLWSISMSFDKTATTHLPEFSLIPHEPSTFNYKAAAKMPVSEVLPGFAGAKVMEDGVPVTSQRPVRVLHLLNMTSGLTYGEEPTPEGRQVLKLIDSCMALLHTDRCVSTVEFANALGQIPLAFCAGQFLVLRLFRRMCWAP